MSNEWVKLTENLLRQVQLGNYLDENGHKLTNNQALIDLEIYALTQKLTKGRESE
jgi:hypothetical protein